MDSHNVPVRIIAAGRVSAMHGEINTFTMRVMQTMMPGAVPSELLIEGMLPFGPGWQDNALRLSSLNVSISFIGDIYAIDDGDIIVMVNSVIHLPPLFVLPEATPPPHEVLGPLPPV